MSIEAGIERTDEFTAEGRLLTDVGGTLDVKVLSTPGMIAMMERCASILAYEQLPDGQATVGFEVCVKHVAAAGEGSDCTVHARLDEADLVVGGDHLWLVLEAVARADLADADPVRHA